MVHRRLNWLFNIKSHIDDGSISPKDWYLRHHWYIMLIVYINTKKGLLPTSDIKMYMHGTQSYTYHKHNNSCMKLEKRPIPAICLTSYLIKTSSSQTALSGQLIKVSTTA